MAVECCKHETRPAILIHCVQICSIPDKTFHFINEPFKASFPEQLVFRGLRRPGRDRRLLLTGRKRNFHLGGLDSSTAFSIVFTGGNDQCKKYEDCNKCS